MSAGEQSDTLTILGCRVDRVDAAGAVARIEELLAAGKPAHVVTLGAEMANLAYGNPRYRDVINSADLVVPDTVGIIVASRMLGKPLRERVAGIELLERLCADVPARGFQVFLLGGQDGVAAGAASALVKRYPGLRVAGVQHGYFPPQDDAATARLVRESGARLVFVGLGFPRQEYWIRDNLAGLGQATCVGVGGSFDVLSGRLPRAPAAIRRVGVEWLYRLVREPRRFVRQLALPVFAARVLRQTLFGPR